MEEIKDYPPYLDYPKPYKPITNADRIRSMSDEELSEFINALTVCDCCSYDGICSEYNNIPKCRKGVLEWLQKPAESLRKEMGG